MKRHTASLLVLFVLAFVFLVAVRDRERRATVAEVERAARFLGVATVDLLEPSAYGAVQATGFRSEIGISGQVITNPTTSTALSVPNNAEHAWITVKTNPVCWANSGADATANGGGEWPAGFITKIDNDRAQLLALRVINCAEGATTVKVWYTRTRRVNE
jgi:hypothetical protein